jgi:hypothetical protein
LKKHMANLGDMRDPVQLDASLNCLNEMIFDALRHIPECMTYLSHLQHPSVFFFCAMPQVMAVATLAALYNNPKVFTGVVKIRKGTACFLMEHATSMPKVRGMFTDYIYAIQAKMEQCKVKEDDDDNNDGKNIKDSYQERILRVVLDAIHADGIEKVPNSMDMGTAVLLSFCSLIGSIVYLVSTHGFSLPNLTDASGVTMLAVCFGSVAFLLAFGLTPFASACTEMRTKKEKTE